MNQPPLQPLHLDSYLSQVKLEQYAKLTTETLLASLCPGQAGALKVRPDGTIIDGHHRLRILQERGVDINSLPREIIPRA